MLAPKGLEGVVVTQSRISDVQAGGVLTYRGQAIETLTARPFLDVAQLVVTGQEDGTWQAWFDATKHIPEAVMNMVLGLPRAMPALQVLQVMAPVVAAHSDAEDPLQRGFAIASGLPEILFSHLIGRPVRLDDSGGYSEQLVRAWLAAGNGNCEEDIQTLAHALNMTQILQIEHSLNAGTFAARVVASTEAGIESAIAAGFGALSGALHGGADEAAMAVADALDTPANAPGFVADMLRQGRKLPGMGHREYRVRDPRATCLDQWADRLATSGDLHDTYLKLQAIEAAFRDEMNSTGKALYTNVDFYKGIIYRALDLPDGAFTGMFALARVYGYIAHYLENAEDNRIFRPQAQYVGV